MSAEVPTPHAEGPPARSRVVRSNRSQVLLFAALTLILTVATVWGGRILLRDSETLVFAVGDANSVEARFANKLATVLKNNNSRLRLKIVPNADSAKALAQFDRRQVDRKQADLAVLRTDGKIPPRARALGGILPSVRSTARSACLRSTCLRSNCASALALSALGTILRRSRELLFLSTVANLFAKRASTLFASPTANTSVSESRSKIRPPQTVATVRI